VSRLERELAIAGRRGLTRRELEARGVTHVEIEVDRSRRRGAVIREDELRLSGEKRYTMLLPPESKPRLEDNEPRPLFDPSSATAKPLSPYDAEAA
jgi:hypothetical protein